MKKVKLLVLDVQKNGLPQYEKQTIEISSDGYINHCLYPMVYLGSMKRYEIQIDKDVIEEFLNQFDFKKWPKVVSKSLDSFSFNLKILFDDGEVSTNSGYINLDMPKEYKEFDEKLINLVNFIESPWLFTK
ncbi:MAG: hypothetical protein ACPKM0_01925 [Pleomorphochaeta sp.]